MVFLDTSTSPQAENPSIIFVPGPAPHVHRYTPVARIAISSGAR
jgi:hypothetical protein